MDFLVNALPFGPVLLTALALFLIGLSFRNRQEIARKFIVPGVLLLGIVCGWFGLITSSGGLLGGALAFYFGLFAWLVAVVGVIYILVILEHSRSLGWKRRIFLGLIVIVYPVAMFLSINIGDVFSPG